MSPDEPSSRGWTRRRWWSVVILVFTVQLSFIAWLGQRTPILPRPAAPAPMLQLAGRSGAELVALTDPTLFVLPHQEGFSGEAWLRATNQEYRPFVWDEPLNWLQPPAEQLGITFEQFVRTNAFPSLPSTPRLEPELAFAPPAAPIEAAQSIVRLAGELRGRQLLNPPELPSWPAADLLTNSIVQILLGPEGRPRSYTLLVSSGLKEADLYALAQARAARFQSLASSDLAPGTSPLAGLIWGQLIFEWQTVPLPTTNGSSNANL